MADSVDRRPLFLFVPLFGGGGTGEFVRSLALARGLHQRLPSARIEFVLPPDVDAALRQQVEFVVHQAPDWAAPGEALKPDDLPLRQWQPDVVVFDSGVRSRMLRLCRRLGIRTAHISDRAGTLRKATRLDVAPLIDLHIIQREHIGVSLLSAWQRLVVDCCGARRVVCDVMLPGRSASDDAAARVAGQGPLVVWAPGGGGYRLDERPVGDVFVDAARQVQAAMPSRATVVLGPAYPNDVPSVPGMDVLKSLPQAALHALFTQADVVAMNGGAGLHIALVAGAPCVAAPLGGDDQPSRIDGYAARGLVMPARPSASDLADAVLSLLRNEVRRTQLREATRATAIVNGFDAAVDSIAALAPGQIGQT